MDTLKRYSYLLVLLVCLFASVWASGIVPALIPNAVPTANKRGNSNVFQLASNNSAASAGTVFCDDGSGNATTSGCSTSGGALTTSGSPASTNCTAFSATTVVTGTGNCIFNLAGGNMFLTNNVAAGATIGQGLDVVQESNGGAVAVTTYGVNAVTNSPGFLGLAARGSVASPAPVQANDVLASYAARGFNGSAFSTVSAGSFRVLAGQTWTTGHNGSYLAFRSTPNGSTTAFERARIFGSGGMSLGNTTDPGTGYLSLQGIAGGGIQCLQTDNNGKITGTNAVCPTGGGSGATYTPPYINVAGSLYGPVLQGPFTAPPDPSTLTWVNQGTAAATAVNGAIQFTIPASSGNNLRYLHTASYPATPWTFTIGILPNIPGADYYSVGIAVSDGTKYQLFALRSYASNGSLVWAAGTSTASNITTCCTDGDVFNWYTGPMYITLQDDGVNFTEWVSLELRRFEASPSPAGRQNCVSDTFPSGDLYECE